MKVAIQGEVGCFSHQAAGRMVPGSTIVPCTRSAEVFERVIRGSVGAAVIPIENSLAGSVAEHYDLLLASKLFIQREFYLRIVHNLIAAPGTALEDIRRVFSHPVALEQCRIFFRQNPKIESIPFYDTAGSVRHVIKDKVPDAAGIAGRKAATAYGGRVLLTGIEDNKQNYTRFFLLQRAYRILPEANKTSLAFGLRNEPGILHKALGVFAAYGISLTKIESRPIQGRPWEYVFFADFMRGDDKVARRALKNLKEVADQVKVLGIYKAARII